MRPGHVPSCTLVTRHHAPWSRAIMRPGHVPSCALVTRHHAPAVLSCGPGRPSRALSARPRTRRITQPARASQRSTRPPYLSPVLPLPVHIAPHLVTSPLTCPHRPSPVHIAPICPRHASSPLAGAARVWAGAGAGGDGGRPRLQVHCAPARPRRRALAARARRRADSDQPARMIRGAVGMCRAGTPSRGGRRGGTVHTRLDPDADL
eukprot:7376575-Prymnesium_polylepis.2